MRNKILMIDDDNDFVEAMKLLLESNGYDVITASNGQEGFAKVKQESPDLILLDMMMSYKTEGADIAQAVSQDAATQACPIILITGAHRDMNFPMELRPDREDLPVKAVVEKPVKPQELLNLIKTNLDKTGKDHLKIVKQIERLAQKWDGKQGTLIMILHEIQNHYGYVPRNISFELSRILGIPMARIYEVITFYNFFKLDPPGKHTISVCMGTACYLKGAPQILQELKSVLHVDEGETTKDGLFHLQVVRCLGCCGLAPVMTIGEKVYGKINKSQVMDILSEYVKEGELKR